MYNNNITNISGLLYLDNVKRLTISKNNVTDISIIRTLPNLTALDMSENNISNIEPLQRLTYLKSLDLSSNKIADISYVSELTSLLSLDFSNNNISDITSLKDLIKLEYLNLDNNLITDISPLSNLNKLGQLYLGYQNITLSDITVNSGDSGVLNNPIKDIKGLSISPNAISGDGVYYAQNKTIKWNKIDMDINQSFSFDQSVSIGQTSASFNGVVTQPFKCIVRQTGDVNNDGQVNIMDISLLANQYNKTSNTKVWNSNFDINKDNITDLFDITIVAKAIK